MLQTRWYLIRPPSLACTCRNEMSWLSVAAYSFTGTLTRPNDTAPFQMARMGSSVHEYDVVSVYIMSYDSDHRQTSSLGRLLVPCQDGGHAPDVRHQGDPRPAGRGVAARGQVGRHPGAGRRARRRRAT